MQVPKSCMSFHTCAASGPDSLICQLLAHLTARWRGAFPLRTRRNSRRRGALRPHRRHLRARSEEREPMTKIELVPLPFAQDALAPAISRETIDSHYDKHHRTYVE